MKDIELNRSAVDLVVGLEPIRGVQASGSLLIRMTR